MMLEALSDTALASHRNTVCEQLTAREAELAQVSRTCSQLSSSLKRARQEEAQRRAQQEAQAQEPSKPSWPWQAWEQLLSLPQQLFGAASDAPAQPQEPVVETAPAARSEDLRQQLSASQTALEQLTDTCAELHATLSYIGQEEDRRLLQPHLDTPDWAWLLDSTGSLERLVALRRQLRLMMASPSEGVASSLTGLHAEGEVMSNGQFGLKVELDSKDDGLTRRVHAVLQTVLPHLARIQDLRTGEYFKYIDVRGSSAATPGRYYLAVDEQRNIYALRSRLGAVSMEFAATDLLSLLQYVQQHHSCETAGRQA